MGKLRFQKLGTLLPPDAWDAWGWALLFLTQEPSDVACHPVLNPAPCCLSPASSGHLLALTPTPHQPASAMGSMHLPPQAWSFPPLGLCIHCSLNGSVYPFSACKVQDTLGSMFFPLGSLVGHRRQSAAPALDPIAPWVFFSLCSTAPTTLGCDWFPICPQPHN